MKRGWRLRPAGSNPHGIPGRPQTDQPKGAAQQALAAAVQLIIGDGLLRPPQHAVGHQQLPDALPAHLLSQRVQYRLLAGPQPLRWGRGEGQRGLEGKSAPTAADTAALEPPGSWRRPRSTANLTVSW